MVSNRVNDTILGAVALSLLASCVGSPLGNTVQRSLEADPQLETSALAEDRSEVPKTAPADDETRSESVDVASTLAPSPAESDSASLAVAGPPVAAEPGDPAFIGPLQAIQSVPPPSADRPAGPAPSPTPMPAADLASVPPDLQPYIRDLQALQLIAVSNSTPEAQASDSLFNQPITRREYARWLFNVNNALYVDDPGQRLRAATPTDTPAFQDVSASDPDFAAIQGLANAGIVPSALTGSSTAVNFRPEAPLSRADLVLWKVPLDTRTALPTTSPEAVNEAWGFQDTASIEPLALRAIAADFQLGDFSNLRRAFGYTTLFQPERAVTRAEAAAVLWRFGRQTNGRSAARVLSEKAD